MLFSLKIVIICAFSYLMGSLNGAIMVSTWVFKRDIRDFGSGNAGLTNYQRTFGKRWVAAVIAIDVLKTVISCLAAWLLFKSGTHVNMAKILAGLFVIVGHSFPLYFKFRGGKGVLVGASTALMLDVRVFAVSVAVFVLIVLLTRYVSLGSMMGSLAFPIACYIFLDGGVTVTVLAIILFIMVVCMHKENIKRLVSGRESKLKLKKK